MTRIEFGNLLEEARKESGLSSVDICSLTRMLPRTYRRIEKATYNFSMKKCLEYIQALGYDLYVQKGSWRPVLFDDYQKIIRWMQKKKDDSDVTIKEITERLEYSAAMYHCIMSGKSVLTSDVFLGFCDIFGYSVGLKKKIEQIDTDG